MLRAAAIQLNSTEDWERNRDSAERAVREVAAQGSRLVVLPEKWNRLAEPATMADAAEPLDGPATEWARDIARELGIDLVAGSITERAGESNHNTAVHVGPGGEVRAAYRKLHLFDVDVEGIAYRESDHETPGEEIVTSELADGTGLGLSVCYDVRFPELFRELGRRGARVFAVPAAFTAPTTRDHWEPVLRTRAIENQVFVVAANQVGEHPPANVCGGRSMIVDPWGTVLARAGGDVPEVIVADLDFDRQDAVRAEFPLLDHRRDDVYGEGVRA
ncbi:MAG: deaminated glutathione amidase [Solirubrobacteraceae bacterium]|jgi:predicted amidohydrolase|nr:deaminated glutathione amidase [Solirubrobacteraceae bacterium]